jgi:CubicO group peptidase (beta-lactamase class C family)
MGLARIATIVAVISPTLAAAQARPERFDSRSVIRLLDTLGSDTTHDLKAVIVSRHGRTELERYFNGDGTETLHDIRSATKSITGLLVGLAIERRLLEGVEVPIGRVLPAGMPAAMARIRVSDLLTMRSGLDSDDRDSLAAGNENRLDESKDWLEFAYGVPIKQAPGERYVYSSLTAFLAGAVVEQVSHQPLVTFADRHLFGPLGIRRRAWRRGPRGEGTGQGNLSIRAQDLLRIGQMVLDHGRFEGRQIVDSSWIEQSLTPHVAIGDVDRYADGYGYLWYTKTYERAGRQITIHFASGNGGNKIYLIPEYDMVVAITSSAYGRGYGQRRSERILLAILDATNPR